MVTKAFIIGYSKYPNKFTVRIPLFEAPGLNINNKIAPSTYEATLCYQPGNIAGYGIGDCVFITFEDDQQDRPVIIGKLYLGVEESSTDAGRYIGDSLNIKNTASLPSSTSIGQLTYNDLYAISKVQEDILTRLKQLENK